MAKRRQLILPSNPLTVRPEPALIVRMMAKLVLCQTSGCWLWGGALDENGYGAIKYKGQVYGVHRIAFALFRRPIRRGNEIDHDERYCKNHSCWNPAHLRESGKHANSSRGARRKTRLPEAPF